MLKKLGVIALALLAVVIGGIGVMYAIDGRPLPAADHFLSGTRFAVTAGTDGSFLFRPASTNRRGLVIMHGALIRPKSYANTAAFFARRGYTVLLPDGGPTRLPINAVQDTVARLATIDVDAWYLIGHSMGGMAVLELLRDVATEVRAAALWGSGVPFAYTNIDVPLLFLWGDADGILTAGRLQSVRQNLPATTRFETVEGGNHRDFAMYSHQFFDNAGRLGWRAQIALANERTAAFFDAADAAAGPVSVSR